MIFPVITSFALTIQEAVKKKLSDIEYLAIKEKDGKLRTNTGQQADGGTGNAAILTAGSGKDLYLAKAQVTVRLDTTSILILGEVTLVANSVIKDRWEFSMDDSVATSAGGILTLTHDFAVQGIKVATTETIVINVVTSDAVFDIAGTLVGFEEDTGESPAV